MALVEPINLSEFNLLPEPATFGPLWAQYYSEVDQLDTPELIAAGTLDAGDVAAKFLAIDTPSDLAQRALSAEIALAPDAELPKAELNGAKVPDGFSEVLSVTPVEAFKGFPPDLTGPPNLGSLTPPPPTTPPPTTPIPGRPPGAIPPEPTQPPLSTQPLVALTNTSKPGQTFFNVGDNFKLELKGIANGAITVDAVLNGRDLGAFPYGTLDATGYRAITGVQQTAQRGEWFQTWRINGVQAVPVIHFLVS